MRRARLFSRFYSRGIVLLAASLIALVNCDRVEVTAVDAARIELSPENPSVAVSQTTVLTATVLSSQGQPLTGRVVQWASLSETIASVDNTGTVRGVAPGVAQIRAATGHASATTAVTVTPAPAIALAPTEVNFTAPQSGATPGDRTVSVTNAGGGALSGLSATITYGTGTPTGWLTATLANTTAPTTLILSVNQGARTPGNYTATVNVSAASSTVPLTVRLTVNPPGQAIALSSTNVVFAAAQGGADPAQQTVGVTNAGGGSLTGLNTSIVYAAGQPLGWLTATLSGTTAPATLTLRAATAGRSPGVYNATVRVMSAVAQNSPQDINVTFTVGSPQPTIALSPRTLSFSAVRGGANPPSQTVEVSNIGGATLSGLTVSVTYPGQQPGGWLNTVLAQTSAPTTITASAATATLPTGTFTATLSVASPGASNSPQTIDVTFQVQEPAPAPPATLTAAPVSAVQINLTWAAAIGVVTRYRIERKTGAAGTYALIDSVVATSTTYSNAGLSSATLYVYRVVACNNTGCSAPSPEASGLTLPGTPSGLIATPVSSTQINLSWTATAGTVDSYRVERSTASGTGFSEIASVSNTTTTQSNTGLSAGTRYYYRVRACNASGCGAYAAEVSAVTTLTAPAPPSGLSASAVSSSQINLAWVAAAGADTIRVERSTTAGSGFSPIASLPNTATAFQNTGLAPATQYFYRIRACNTGGCSAFTAEATATTLVAAPGAPSGLSATATSSSQINLSWTAGTGTTDTYRIERRPGPGMFQEIGTTTGTTTGYADLGLSALTLYEYRVRACNSGGCSAYSPQASATTLQPPPGAPSGLLATAVSATQINLSWTAATGTVATYRVERGAASDGVFTEIASLANSATTFQNSALSPLTPYFYRVRACNPGGCSGYTTVVTATTLAAEPDPQPSARPARSGRPESDPGVTVTLSPAES